MTGASRVSRASARRRKRAPPRGRRERQPTAGQQRASVHGRAPSPTTPADDAEAKKRAIIQAALERARKKKEELAKLGAVPKNTERVSADVQAQIDAAEERRRRLGLKTTAIAPEKNDSDH